MLPALRRKRTDVAVSLFVVALGIAGPAFAGGDDLPRPKRAKASNVSLQKRILAQTQALLDAQKREFAEEQARKQSQIDALQAQVAALSAEVRAMKTQAVAVAAPPPVPTPVPAPPAREQAEAKPAGSVTFKNITPTLSSADQNFTLTVRSLFQFDAASYFQDKDMAASVTARDLNSGTNFRRARVGMTGKAYEDFDYAIWLEFGGSGAEDVGRFHEAWIQYNGFKPAKIRIGELAPSVGLGDATSTSAIPFLERAAVSELSRGMAAGDTRMGITAFNNTDNLFWAVAVTGNTVSTLNTQASGFVPASHDEQLGVTARIAGTPFKGKNWLIHTGLNYSGIINPADAGPSTTPRFAVQLRERPELRVDGTRLIDTGAIDAESASVTGVELAWQSGRFFAEGEAFRFHVARRNPTMGLTDPVFSGWYLEGGWALTGETRSYNIKTAAFDNLTPTHNFDPKTGHWGAFELVARYSNLDLDHNIGSAVAADRVRGGQQDIASVGIGWTLNPSIRFIIQGQDVKITRMSGTGDMLDQSYQTFAIRSQFGF